MLKLSKMADYATVLMASLAADPGTLVSASVLAERSRLVESTVAKLLKLLAQRGLVDSVRGARGGYRLARPARQISVADIVVAIEGPIGWTACSVHQGGCDRETFCGVSANLLKIAVALEAALKEVTLQDLLAAPASWRPRVAVDRMPTLAVLTEEVSP